MSPEIWAELADLGVIGALFTEEQGGFGGDGFDIAAGVRGTGPRRRGRAVARHGVLGGGLIAALGDDAQQALVEEVIGGALQLAFAHGEPAQPL